MNAVAKKKQKPEAPAPKNPADYWMNQTRELQEKHGFTNKQMANWFHVSIRTYLGWRYGEKVPTAPLQELIKLAVSGSYPPPK